jgi:hypothetical protein
VFFRVISVSFDGHLCNAVLELALSAAESRGSFLRMERMDAGAVVIPSLQGASSVADTHIIGWKLDRRERAQLLVRFPPHWPDVIADHVTLARVPRSVPPPCPVQAEIVGGVDDGQGLQALAVRIDGTTSRPDGGIYHITWSLDRARGREARQSNDVLKVLRWVEWPEAVPISVFPASWE